MKVKIDKSFERDAKRLPVQIQKEIKEVIQKIWDAQSMQKLEVSKMEGAKNAYRIRLSNYRIGFYLENDCIVLSRVLDRKEIYRYFPKK